jgi:hypothetical protein
MIKKDYVIKKLLKKKNISQYEKEIMINQQLIVQANDESVVS